MTVHDLVALDHPELHPKRAVVLQRRQLEAARDRATVVLTVSRATAGALCSRGVDPERIVVAPCGVTTMPPSDRSLVPPGTYLLVVGTLTARKGLETLVAAFSRADLHGSVRLVLAGAMGWGGQHVSDAIERHGVGDRVSRLGRVSDAQLAGLYQGCLAVCVPSIAEGFGLPLVEAAAVGAPVVASDIPVFHEIEGSVALYARPSDEQAWADALERIIADEELRWDAAALGRAVAREYTWDRTAALTIAAYERARQAA
jgi:glycosyltransferase involved in cell wall biosynthesis